MFKGFQKPKRLVANTETLNERYGMFTAQPFERGFGTTIGICLPEEHLRPEDLREEEPSSQLPRGTETVLVAEDDPYVRKLRVRILAALGYDVVQAENGERSEERREGNECRSRWSAYH